MFLAKILWIKPVISVRITFRGLEGVANGFIQKTASREKKVIAALVKTAYYCAGFSRDVQRSVSEGLHPGETWFCGGQGQGHHGDLLSGITFS